VHDIDRGDVEPGGKLADIEAYALAKQEIQIAQGLLEPDFRLKRQRPRDALLCWPPTGSPALQRLANFGFGTPAGSANLRGRIRPLIALLAYFGCQNPALARCRRRFRLS
jgi:hypothetical protein